MALVGRRGWLSLKTEVWNRLGGINYDGFFTVSTGGDSRLDQWITSAYLDFCATFHHPELDADATATLSVGTSSVALPADCYALVGARLKLANGTYVASLKAADLGRIWNEFQNRTAQPTFYARENGLILFDCAADNTYTVEILYYKIPPVPDFTSDSSSSALKWECDEHLIQWTLAYAFPGLGRPEIGGYNGDLLKDWLAAQIRPQLAMNNTPDAPEESRSNKTRGQAA